MIRLLSESDAEQYAELRREMLHAAPLAFGSSPGEDFVSEPDAARAHIGGRPDKVIFGAFDDGLVGAAGLFRDRHRKSAHRAHLWGTYVRPAARRRGLGAELVRAVLQHAASMPGIASLHLEVSSAAPAAQKLYESLGFRSWGLDEDVLRVDDESISEHLMAVRFDTRPTDSTVDSDYASECRTTIADAPNLRVRLLALGAGQAVPWHYHNQITDTFFCMEGPMKVTTRAPAAEHILAPGGTCAIAPGTPHHVAGIDGRPCRFLIVQGVGPYDYVSVDE